MTGTMEEIYITSMIPAKSRHEMPSGKAIWSHNHIKMRNKSLDVSQGRRGKTM